MGGCNVRKYRQLGEPSKVPTIRGPTSSRSDAPRAGTSRRSGKEMMITMVMAGGGKACRRYEKCGYCLGKDMGGSMLLLLETMVLGCGSVRGT